MERVFIKDVKAGQAVSAVYILRSKELLKTKTGKPYLRITLADKTGTIEGKVWDAAEAADSKVIIGGIVSVNGAVDTWQGIPQINVNDIRPAEEGAYEPRDLIRVLEDADGVYRRVISYLEAIENGDLKHLAEQFLNDEDFIRRFKTSPGARSWHNAYIGGLLEHTYEVMAIVDKACELYPAADRDMCIIGAFLHDIGKIYELDPSSFEYTIEGGLIGHLPIGFELVSRKTHSIETFPKQLAVNLKHIILSHHGEYEQQSPVLPKTLEATIVYQADELVSQANAVKELIQAQSGSNKDWTGFVNIKNRKYFLKGGKR